MDLHCVDVIVPSPNAISSKISNVGEIESFVVPFHAKLQDIDSELAKFDSYDPSQISYISPPVSSYLIKESSNITPSQILPNWTHIERPEKVIKKVLSFDALDNGKHKNKAIKDYSKLPNKRPLVLRSNENASSVLVEAVYQPRQT